MADYWKSNERKYCDFCKCWISDNKASISFHENGKRHKANVAKRITDISKQSEKNEQERRKMELELRKMEEAAMLSYAKDISARGDMTASRIGTVMDAVETVPKAPAGAPGSRRIAGRQIDPVRLQGDSDEEDGRVMVKKIDPESVPNASLWVEGKSDEGYTYYWNVKTNESVWEEPKEGYLSWDEYQRINDLAVQQQEIQQAKEAKNFRDNVDEEVARYNRERLKMFRRPETVEEKRAREEHKQSFKTEEDATAPVIGQWQVVEHKPPPEPIDWELPQTKEVYVPPVVSEPLPEPPVKRFKEKVIEKLDPDVAESSATTFKKRKLANKSNARQRLDVD